MPRFLNLRVFITALIVALLIMPVLNASAATTPTLTYTGVTTVEYNHSAAVSATFTDPSNGNAAVAGESITFTLGASATETCTATTDASGSAACSFVVTDSPGSYTLNVTFAGDSTYAAASLAVPFTVTQAVTKLTYTGPTLIAQGNNEIGRASCRERV